MTESKKLQTIEGFTPGPWEAAESSVLCVDGQVAQAFGPTLGQSRPNGRLIAAAPDLYRIAHQQREVMRKLESDLRAALEWIDAVPSETVLPAMPGFDRDEVDSNLAAAAPFLED